ncbi:MAG: hypothetical protein GX054_07805 [Clostridiales bacterium]|nr:hypothetical protein [Clostridiales bacterium]
MKKTIKIMAGITAIILIGILLFVANGMVGNPVSKTLAKQSASKYIQKNYPNLDLKVERVNYSFKTGSYYALIKSQTSIDTHFNLDISMTGKILYDSYESHVISGWNTWQRIDLEYRTMVDKVLNAPDFPYDSHIDFGSIEIKETDIEIGPIRPAYGLVLEDLELDKKYDVKELAKTAGHITIYIESEEVTIKKASEILMELKEIFDKEDVPFYAIDFALEKPRKDDGLPNDNREEIWVKDFLYSDIYEEGLEERLTKAFLELKEYYEKEDAKYKESNQN